MDRPHRRWSPSRGTAIISVTAKPLSTPVWRNDWNSKIMEIWTILLSPPLLGLAHTSHCCRFVVSSKLWQTPPTISTARRTDVICSSSWSSYSNSAYHGGHHLSWWIRPLFLVFFASCLTDGGLSNDVPVWAVRNSKYIHIKITRHVLIWCFKYSIHILPQLLFNLRINVWIRGNQSDNCVILFFVRGELPPCFSSSR